MIKIIKHAQKEFEMVCSKCGCVFTYELEDIGNTIPGKVECPECGEYLYHPNQVRFDEEPEPVTRKLSGGTSPYYDNCQVDLDNNKIEIKLDDFGKPIPTDLLGHSTCRCDENISYSGTLQSKKRFLSDWNVLTGKPNSEPSEQPFDYQVGDYYFIEGVLNDKNLTYKGYLPAGTSYPGLTEIIAINETLDAFIYEYKGNGVWKKEDK